VGARLLFVAVVALFFAAGCGSPTHAAISHYLTRVQDVEKSMLGPLQQVSTANQSFARSQQGPHVAQKLAASEKTLRSLRDRLASVKAPPQAQHLRTLLLQLVDQEVALAHEVRLLAAFVPQYQSALRPLQPAGATLKTKLSATAKGKAATKALDTSKADELGVYAHTLDSVIATIHALDPPAVWRPTYTQQLASLTQMRVSAIALAAAVHANNATAIPNLLQKFDAAAVSNQSFPAQKRAIAAVKAYDARINALGRLAQRVQSERLRLERRFK
jgi:hypothetical protein